MPRPSKPGLDYFPFDTALDRKFEILEAKHGLNGFGIIIKLMQRAYGENGYFLEFTDIDALLLGSKYGLTDKDVLDYVDTAVEQGIFDRGVYEENKVLTSHGMQLRFVKSVKRRDEVSMKREYLLLSVREIPDNVYINGVNVYNNSQNVDDNTQSKVKESKVKNSKVKESSKDVGAREAAVAKTAEYFEKIFGIVTHKHLDTIVSYIEDGVEPEMIIAAIDEAVDQGKRTWTYAKAIIDNKINAGIKTLRDFRRAEADYKAEKEAKRSTARLGPDKQRKSKFNNYEDDNKTDYAELEKQILDMMLDEEGDNSAN